MILAEFAEVNMSNKMWKLLKRLTCCSNILSENYEDFVILFFNLDMSKLTVILSLPITWGGVPILQDHEISSSMTFVLLKVFI